MVTNEPARHPAGGDEIFHKDLSYKIVGIAMRVHKFEGNWPAISNYLEFFKRKT